MRTRRLLLPVLAVLAVALPGAAAAADAQTQLADRYAPVVRLVDHPEACGSGEPYVPTDVRAILPNAEVALRGPWDTTNVAKIGPTEQDLGKGLWEYSLDFPGNPLDPGCIYEQWSERVNAGRLPTVYSHVVADPAYPGQVALQYWFFYVFNDFNNKHEGDWEMIQLNFPAPDAAAALKTSPTDVGYSQHEGGERAEWGGSKLQLVNGTHPVVYPAAGSHANYYSEALFLGRTGAQGVGCDDTENANHVVDPVVAVMPQDQAAALAEYPWLGFLGRWGERQPAFYNGPTGPNLKTQWTQPITWAKETWRADAYAVPTGNSIGPTATGFFCGAVAAVSNVITRAALHPLPVLAALLGLVILVIWIASRTTWVRCPPLRLSRRRRWGGLIRASWAIYRERLGLFVGIGVLFLPLAVVISIVQYLLFKVVGLARFDEVLGDANAFVAGLALGLGLLFTLAGLVVVQAATAAALREIDEGRPVSPRRAYALAFQRIVSLLGGLLRMAVIVVLLDLTVVGIPIAAWLIVRWSLFAQVVQLEGHPAHGALRRSGSLVRGRWLRVASITVGTTGLAIIAGPIVGGLMLLLTTASFNVVNLVAGLVYMVTLPLAAVATTYVYYDVVTRDALDPRREDAPEILPAEIPVT